jgi:hypothetical protein
LKGENGPKISSCFLEHRNHEVLKVPSESLLAKIQECSTTSMKLLKEQLRTTATVVDDSIKKELNMENETINSFEKKQNFDAQARLLLKALTNLHERYTLSEVAGHVQSMLEAVGMSDLTLTESDNINPAVLIEPKKKKQKRTMKNAIEHNLVVEKSAEMEEAMIVEQVTSATLSDLTSSHPSQPEPPVEMVLETPASTEITNSTSTTEKVLPEPAIEVKKEGNENKSDVKNKAKLDAETSESKVHEAEKDISISTSDVLNGEVSSSSNMPKDRIKRKKPKA